MGMLQTARAVFFDAGGTLLFPYPSVGQIYQKVAAGYGCKAEADDLEMLFREAWLKRDGLADFKSHADEKKEREWWQGLVYEVFGKVGGIQDFDGFFHELYDFFARPEAWKVYEDTFELLNYLKSRGTKLGIISNWDSRLFKLCEAFGLDEYFEFVLASAVFGASKPSPKIFREALKLSGVEPYEAVHIGDSFEDDIRGAQAVGIQCILIDRHKHPRPPQHNPTIRNFKELL